MDVNQKLASDLYRTERWPKVLNVTPIAFMDKFLTQSQNSSAKMGLCVDEYFKNFVEFGEQRNDDWNQLEDVVLYTTYETFMFHNFAFYYRMFKNVIDNLIPTGVMKHLIENYYTKKWKFEKLEDEPKVLSLDDLIFGFNIWLGCCLITIIVFFAEQIGRIKSRVNRNNLEELNYLKIHPLEGDATEPFSSLGMDFGKSFKIKEQRDEL
ncbi:hypothetical protein ACKWTF_003962 [Chironomus riparius]